MTPTVVPGCPKNMVYGPCGGVEFDGGCEVADPACVFLGRDLPRWPSDALESRPTRIAGAAAMADRLSAGHVVVADFLLAHWTSTRCRAAQVCCWAAWTPFWSAIPGDPGCSSRRRTGRC